MAELLVSAVPELRERLVADGIRRGWGALVGPDVARHARPQALSGGCLQVVVDNSPWLHELTLRTAELTARVAARFDTVRSLRFTLGRLQTAAETSAPPAARPVRALGPDDVREIDESVVGIRDPEARAAARRLLAAARRSSRTTGEMTRGVE